MTGRNWKQTEGALFTLAVGLLLGGAIWISRTWPARASIIILVLGTVALLLAFLQFFLDLKGMRFGASKAEGHFFDAPAVEPETQWGNIEIWSWIIGFYLTIHVIGFLAAAPLFVILYAKVYGAGWFTAVGLAAMAWGFLYGIFEHILHVPWPEPLFEFLM